MATMSKTMSAYNKLRQAKKKFCEGKMIKSAVKAQATNYVSAAVSSGQDRKEAEKKAKRVLMGGCKVSSAINRKPRKRKAATRKRK